MDNNKKRFIESLQEANGIISTACNNCDISRQTFYNWKKDDPEFALEVDIVNENAIDHVESKLMEKINGVTIGKISDGELNTYDQPPSDTAIIFFLKCKAKKRGYVERTEVSPVDPDGNSIQPVININVIRTKKEEDQSL